MVEFIFILFYFYFIFILFVLQIQWIKKATYRLRLFRGLSPSFLPFFLSSFAAFLLTDLATAEKQLILV